MIPQGLVGVLQLLSLLAPIVKTGVELAEQAIGPGRGTEKLVRAVDHVEQALPKVEQLAGQVDAVRAAVKPLIEATVAAANASGAFKRSRKKRAKA